MKQQVSKTAEDSGLPEFGTLLVVQ